VKLVGVGALAVVFWLPVRTWCTRWGTAPEELARVMPGDALIPEATEMSMQAVTVEARPEHIWPRLVHIGYRLDDRRTRFVTLGSEQVPYKPPWRLGIRIMEPAWFMPRRFLSASRRRPKRRRRSSRTASRSPPTRTQASRTDATAQ
jgi:hypothetical protein